MVRNVSNCFTESVRRSCRLGSSRSHRGSTKLGIAWVAINRQFVALISVSVNALLIDCVIYRQSLQQAVSNIQEVDSLGI